jgi:hypothetical protein
MRLLIALCIFFTATPVFACVADSDCEGDGKCVKGTSMYGVCLGGKSGAARDFNPRKDLPTENEPSRFCADDSDCPPGTRCADDACVKE